MAATTDGEALLKLDSTLTVVGEPLLNPGGFEVFDRSK